MRDSKRIRRILTLLQKIWEYQTDVRFNQLISNLQHIYSQQNNGFGKRIVHIPDGVNYVESSHLDLFFLEDDRWEKFLEDYLLSIEEEWQKEIDKIDTSIVDEVVSYFQEAGIESEDLNEQMKEKIKLYLIRETKTLEIGAIIKLLSTFSYMDQIKLFQDIQKL